MDCAPPELSDLPALKARLLDCLDRAVIATGADGRVLYWNRRAEELYGWRADEALGRNILELTPAVQSQAEAAAIMASLQAGEHWEGEILLQRRGGQVFPAYVVDSPVLDDAGRLVAVVGVSWDVSAARRASERQALQVCEYRHRVKNLLAGFQFMADQAFRSHQDPAEVRAALTARVKAMARAQDLASSASAGAVDMARLVRAALEPFAGGAAGLDGPTVVLAPEHVEMLAMAVHELATNAAKHGAWSSDGRVEIAWNCRAADSRSVLDLSWRETGGPPASPPSRRGFGLRLLSDGLPRQLDGIASLEFPTEGVRYGLSFPL